MKALINAFAFSSNEQQFFVLMRINTNYKTLKMTD